MPLLRLSPPVTRAATDIPGSRTAAHGRTALSGPLHTGVDPHGLLTLAWEALLEKKKIKNFETLSTTTKAHSAKHKRIFSERACLQGDLLKSNKLMINIT